jgi:hypothetical protein
MIYNIALNPRLLKHAKLGPSHNDQSSGELLAEYWVS